jgi:small-conductance mechanosensitive channel
VTDPFLSAFRSYVSRLAEANGTGLVTALVLLGLLAVLAPRPRRRKLRLPLVLLVLYLVVLGLRELFHHGTATYIALGLVGLFLLLSCIGQALFALLTKSVLGRLLGTPSKIFLDIVQALVYVVALLVTLRAAGVNPTSLLTGSAVLTAVVGLSLRDTLGNLFAGLAIQAQRPFEVGDWIQFDRETGHIGQVVEINWRATKVLTNDSVEIIIPNATLGQGHIINFTKPRKFSRRTVRVNAPYHVPPQHVHTLLVEAAAGAWGVLAEPPPSAVTSAFEDDGIQYRLRFYTADFDKRELIDAGVRDRIWYTLHRHGIDIPAPQRTVRLESVPERPATDGEERRQARALKALRRVDFFEPAGDEALHQLATLARSALYGAGETIIRQGEPGEALFIIEKGEVDVMLERPGEAPVEVARLGPGSFFGEMSLLTGEPRTATVRASRQCELLVVDKAAFAPVLDSFPETAERVSEVIAGRQAGLRDRRGAAAAADGGNGEDWGVRLLKAIREFFSLRSR